MKRHDGFTLIELMVTIAVAVVILTLAVPGFRSIIQNNRAATQANDLVTALGLARSEAIKRGLTVSLCPSSDQATCTGGTAWEEGWIVFLDRDGDGSRDPDGDPDLDDLLLRVHAALDGGSTLAGPANLRFQAAGSVNAIATFQHRIDDCSGDQGRNIDINLSGRVNVTRVACGT